MMGQPTGGVGMYRGYFPAQQQQPTVQPQNPFGVVRLTYLYTELNNYSLIFGYLFVYHYFSLFVYVLYTVFLYHIYST